MSLLHSQTAINIYLCTLSPLLSSDAGKFPTITTIAFGFAEIPNIESTKIVDGFQLWRAGVLIIHIKTEGSLSPSSVVIYLWSAKVISLKSIRQQSLAAADHNDFQYNQNTEAEDCTVPVYLNLHCLDIVLEEDKGLVILR